MSKRSKSLIGLLVSLMAILVIAACSNDENANGEGEDTNDEDVTLDIFSWRSGDTEEFNEIISAFKEEHPTINVNFDPTTAPEYDSALNTQLSTETGADIFFVRPFALGKNIFDAGHLETISEGDIASMENVADIQKDIYTSEDGEVYAVPFNYVSYGFLYNKTMFEENGWEEPETWDDFFTLMEQIKATDVTPLALGTADGWVVDEIVASGFYPSFVDGEEWRQGMIDGDNKLTDPEYVSFLDGLTNWPDYMPNNFEGIGYVDSLQQFMAENAAIWVTGSWALTDIDADELNFDLDMFASPVVNKGDKRWVGFNGGAGLGINSNSEHKEEAKIFLDWLMSNDAQSMIANLLPGQFPAADVSIDQIESEVNRKWLEVGGEDGENYATGLAFEVFNGGDPTLGTLQIENITALLAGELSPEEAAENMQNGLESWYEPFK
ncbi:extracellular solute-binding protein [Virgibacillus sp. C22-A2]|uniref:Probable sugar-binding periplasmic protein n=1 Tax=Virgibacillus tibetensis TaxID=3042313 RepID=A0ABU6KDI6_9BACI|nr:extracellular solute-binding protein [Virgibacillus sp. C22-A2]